MCQRCGITSFMGNKSFKLKQFEVFHDKCAMKVGTDGMLLGAWAGVDGCQNILDVGAGTGLISLMLAQRNRGAHIMALEIDTAASEQALENVNRSPFFNQIEVKHSSFQHFASTTKMKFDAIVSNPPFFINSLKPDNESRLSARHTDFLSLVDILSLSRQLLTPCGKLSLIYPYDEIANIDNLIEETNWYVHRKTEVYSTPGSTKPKRLLLELGLCHSDGGADIKSLIIEIDRHVYSTEYIELTKDFYLKM